MITAGEAKSIVRSSCANISNDELKKIERIIYAYSSSGKSEFSLSTGLTEEYKKKQDVLFPDFTGSLHEETITVLRWLGYSVVRDSSYQGNSITIKW